MKKHYPYRFKTKEEFINEFGKNFQRKITYTWNDNNKMDYLFGIPYPFDINEKQEYLPDLDQWVISWDMLTLNEKSKPTYESKNKTIRII